jgi:predicted membrane-bound mannosyltransferase/DNA-binding beta-propeller fold protein YncE
MADVTLGRGTSIPQLRVRVVEWVVAHKEVVTIASLMALAAVIRFWDLGDMALHHDESLHAFYTWRLYDGQGYAHNPLMHGPFLFHSGAVVYFLFGDSDMTARFLPALFGSALVGMPFLLRKQLGMTAVIIAAVLLTFSPTILYFSRFYRNEAYMAVWTLGLVICIWRYLDERKPFYLYVMAAVLALSFATKEVTFITAAIFLLFIDLMLAVELGRRREDEEIDVWGVAKRTVLLAPVAWLVAASWPLLGKQPFGRDALPPIGDVMVVFGTLCLPQFAAGIQVLPFVGDDGYNVQSEERLRIIAVASLLLASLYVGLLWRPWVWAIAAASFFIPYVLLYTTFFTNVGDVFSGEGGFFSGIWGSLDYWLDQHHERRGDQPAYYYALLTPLYEFLPLIAAAGGTLWLALRGDSLRRWLLFWLVGIFIGLSLAGEKMPWLEVHVALPLTLLAALSIARAVEALDFEGRWWPAASAATATAAAVYLMVDEDGVLQVLGFAVAAGLLVWLIASFSRDLPERIGPGLLSTLASFEVRVTLAAIAGLAVLVALGSTVDRVGFDPWFAVWVIALAPLALAGHLVAYLMRGSKSFGRAALVVGVAALLTLTVRAGLTASFTHDDTPVEMLVYTQTSPDIPDLRDRIDALARHSGLGHNLPIVVDQSESFAWPWAWYLRDYHQVSYATVSRDYEPPAGAVLLVNRSNAGFIQDAGAYSQTPYRHRWWFNETYRDLNFREAGEIVTSRSGLESLVRFFLHRRSETNIGSVDGVAFFPNDLSAFDYQPGPAAPPREPTRLADRRIVLGAQGVAGSAGGEFSQPAGMFAAREGNLWVADGRNHRIQKFDREGNFVDAFGRSGTGPGTFQEPWSVAVDSEGFIYVADTWNHRIQKFSPDLQLVASWGRPAVTASPGPLELFGPRDIAVAADGTLWVADTGNERILQYSRDGEPLASYGSEGSAAGQFAEPVGLTVDAAGNILVADTWNARIQRLSPGLEPSGAFSVGWSSKNVLDKPYLAVLADGRILTSVPESGNLLLLDSEGNRVGAWKPLPDSMPVGVVALPGGGFAFSDIRRNEVQIVPANLVDGFFR